MFAPKSRISVVLSAAAVTAAQLGCSTTAPTASTTPTTPRAAPPARSAPAPLEAQAFARSVTFCPRDSAVSRALDVRTDAYAGIPPLAAPVRHAFAGARDPVFGRINEEHALRMRSSDGNAVLLQLRPGSNPFDRQATPAYGLAFMWRDGLAYPVRGTVDGDRCKLETTGPGLPAWEAEVPADGRYATQLSEELNRQRLALSRDK